MENKNLSKSLALYGKYNRLNPAFLTILIQSQRINKHKMVDVTIPTYGKNFVEELKMQGYLAAPSYSKVAVGLIPKGNALKVCLEGI